MQIVDMLALKNTRNVGDDALLKLITFMSSNHIESFELLDAVLPELNTLSKPSLAALHALLSAENSKVARALAVEQADLLIAHQITAIPYSSERYPLSLTQLKKPPPLLFCRGNMSLLQNTKNVAVVGTRKHTPRGELLTQGTVRALAEAQCAIVSGLALGIDAIAHNTALHYHAPTIAVLVDLVEISPAKHRGLAESIIEQGGLLVSENPPNTTLLPALFSKRNRIQAGLSCALFAIESASDGGTMHAVNTALELGRPIYVPDAERAKYEDLTLKAISGTQHLANTKQAIPYAIDDLAEIIAEVSVLSKMLYEI